MSLYLWFTDEELACRCGCGLGAADMDTVMMARLERLREDSSIVMALSSAIRCPEYNAKVSKKTGLTGPHTTGRAVDTLVFGADAKLLQELAGEYAFTGIGVKQHGSHADRFLHLDDLPEAPGQPRPWLWSYS
jgi:uncharacterized protein YcbK (DUF882 family)